MSSPAGTSCATATAAPAAPFSGALVPEAAAPSNMAALQCQHPPSTVQEATAAQCRTPSQILPAVLPGAGLGPLPGAQPAQSLLPAHPPNVISPVLPLPPASSGQQTASNHQSQPSCSSASSPQLQMPTAGLPQYTFLSPPLSQCSGIAPTARGEPGSGIWSGIARDMAEALAAADARRAAAAPPPRICHRRRRARLVRQRRAGRGRQPQPDVAVRAGRRAAPLALSVLLAWPQ